jgi:hypothetical protein
MLKDHASVLKDLKARVAVYHQSNIFFRDIQYGIQAMLREQGIRVRYTEAERLAREFVERMEQENIFVAIDRQTWALRYPEFKTPKVEKAARPAGPGSPVPGSAAAGPGAQAGAA